MFSGIIILKEPNYQITKSPSINPGGPHHQTKAQRARLPALEARDSFPSAPGCVRTRRTPFARVARWAHAPLQALAELQP